MYMANTIIIPIELAKEGELILIPRRKYEELLERQKVTELDILRWAKEAKNLKKIGKLPKLGAWKDFEK